MSVMSMGKKPKVLVRPLRAGNSRAGGRPGQVRAGAPGPAASGPEKRNVPGVSKVTQPGVVVPPRPGAGRRRPPARPRLWVVPDAAVPDAAEPEIPGPDPAGPAVAGPDVAGPARRRVRGCRWYPGRGWPPTSRFRPVAERPTAGCRPRAAALGAPGRGAPGRGAPGRGSPGRRRSSRTRVVRAASAPSRTPVRRARRTRLTRRGRRVVWASAVLLLVAVITPVLLAMASGAQAASGGLPPSAVRAGLRQVVVKPGQSLWSIALNAEPHGRPAGGHPADHPVQRAGQPGRRARREPLGPPGLTRDPAPVRGASVSPVTSSAG